MGASWATEEVRSANLRDRRLNRRLVEVLSQLAARPAASIPAACGVRRARGDGGRVSVVRQREGRL